MNSLKVNLQTVRTRVESACLKAGRKPSEVTVLAVSKRHPSIRIRELYDLGQREFGENYVQEALAKQEQLAELDIVWHFIGPLQSNKTREVAQNFHWVQSADRKKVLKRLSDQRPESLSELNVCIQVNIDREERKSGVLPENLKELAQYVCELKNLRLRGLMAIPQPATPDHDPSGSYLRMGELFQGLIASGIELDTLSMGMSADLEQAIIHGSTMIRIGTSLLGPRPSKNQEISKKETS
jgi:pyridoxal phosphate enzyme (YggS family)